jgi:hypothetical protein
MFREFMEELRGEVLAHVRAGRSRDEVKQLVKLPKYEKWGAYKEWFPLNVEGMYDSRIDLDLTGVDEA